MVLTFDLGSGVVSVRSSGPVAVDKWHSVSIRRNGKTGEVKIDQQPAAVNTSQGSSFGLEVAPDTYLGGVPQGFILPAIIQGLKGMIKTEYETLTVKVKHNLVVKH